MPSESQPAVGHLVDVRWGVSHSLHRVCTGIGRDAANPILIRDPAASRTQAEVQRSGDAYVLHPIGTAETRVNGVVLTAPRPLAEGDVVEIAYTRLRFTRNAPDGDVVPAPEHAAVDAEFAGRTTEIREIVSPEKLQELRRELMRPVELHWRVILGGVIVAALALALLIRLAIRLWPG